MLGITFSPQNYHHHQQFLSKLRENNENDMTSVVWVLIVFGPVYGRSQLATNTSYVGSTGKYFESVGSNMKY